MSKTSTVGIRLSQEQREHLEARAKLAGVSLSEYLRTILTSTEIIGQAKKLESSVELTERKLSEAGALLVTKLEATCSDADKIASRLRVEARSAFFGSWGKVAYATILVIAAGGVSVLLGNMWQAPVVCTVQTPSAQQLIDGLPDAPPQRHHKR